MRNKPNTLLAGVAALALFAGTGIALAQQSPQGQKSAPGAPGMSEQSGMHAQSAKPAAKPDAGAGMEQHAQTGATGDKTSGAASNAKADQPGMAQQSAPGAKGENRENRSAQDIKGNKMGPAADKTAQSPEEISARTRRARASTNAWARSRSSSITARALRMSVDKAAA